VKQIEIEVFDGPLGELSVDTFVVPIPTNERPLRGTAGWLDWRLCGRISEEILSKNLTGATHEAVLLPAGPPLGARLMLLGIGAAELQPGRGVQDAFRDLSLRLLGLRSERALVALPAAIDLYQDSEACLRGCLQSMSAFRGDGLLRLVVSGTSRLARALSTAAVELEDEMRRRRVRVFVEAPKKPAPVPRSVERIL